MVASPTYNMRNLYFSSTVSLFCQVLLWHVWLSAATRSVCYEHIGCFSNAPPFDNALGDLPKSPSVINTRFFLFTSNSADFEELVHDDEAKLVSSAYNPQDRTIFIIHGFTSEANKPWSNRMVSAFVQKGGVNVVTVDWKNGAKLPYTQACANARVTGAIIARFVEFLLRATSATDPGKFHLIGHSLGAHVAGYAGERLPNLGRITGLDPAEPHFEHKDVAVRLDRDDALFVDVIHTDASPIHDMGLGLAQPVGDIDFYPNGGKEQPGCPKDGLGSAIITAITKGFDAVSKQVMCSHERALDLFTETILAPSSCQFVGIPCYDEETFNLGQCHSCGQTTCPTMGYHVDTGDIQFGSFYLNTEAENQFCVKHYMVSFKTSSAMRYAYGKINIKVIGQSGEATGSFSDDGKSIKMWSDVRDLGLVVTSRNEIGAVQSMELAFIKGSGFGSWGSSNAVYLAVLRIDNHTGNLGTWAQEMVLNNGNKVTLS